MIEIKCGDMVQFKAFLGLEEINLRCKVIEYKNNNGFPKHPTLKALEDCGKVKKGQVFGGSISDIVSQIGSGQ